MNTIKSALQNARQCFERISDSASLDAEILLCQVLEKNRSYLRAWPEKQLDAIQLQNYHTLIQKRALGTPVAYLTGTREFWARNFDVCPDVLIPRPDTELLVEICLSRIPPDKPLKVVDLGTGSGAIAVTLAAERPKLSITAVDFCPAALRIAKQNAEKHKIKSIRFIESDWLQQLQGERFNLVISNPPYIARDDPHLSQGEIGFEPQQALISGKQGLDAINTISTQALKHFHCSGLLLFEHGYQQAQSVQSILNKLGYVNIRTYKDLSGNDRVTLGEFTGNQ